MCHFAAGEWEIREGKGKGRKKHPQNKVSGYGLN